MKIGDATRSQIAAQLRGDGLGLQFGDYSFRLQSPLPAIARAAHVLYAHHPLQGPAEFSEFRLRFDSLIDRGRPAVFGMVNGQIWYTWPTRLTVAALEWVTSWCFFRGAADHLAVHAASATFPDRPDVTIVFPGDSGAGKSTLASTLMMQGWGLLSDEISMFDIETLAVTALGRPTILKGHSLQLMRVRYGDRAVLGPVGRIVDPPSSVAHLQPTEQVVQRRGQSFAPAALVFPRRGDHANVRLAPMSPGQAFALLNRYGINHRLLGPQGFQTGHRLATELPAYELFYQDAGQAEIFLRSATELRSAVKLSSVTSTQIVSNLDSATESPSIPTPNSTRASDSGDWQQELTLLPKYLRNPDRLVDHSLAGWDRTILVASHLELLPQLARRVSQRDWFADLAPAVQRRLRHENQRSAFNRKAMEFELRQLRSLLADFADPIVLLKGVAYLEAGFGWAQGRRTNDIDLLVPESALTKIQTRLQLAGYSVEGELSEADCRYYRRWLHELPPLLHAYRRVEVDVHFRLLPVADPWSFPVDDLIARADPIGDGVFSALDRVDRALHVMLNLAHTGEFLRTFRDLWDLCCIVEEDDAFGWAALIQRCKQLRLTDPVALVLLLGQELMGLELPAGTVAQLTGRDEGQLRRRYLYRTMRTAAIPSGVNMRSRGRRAALWAMEHYPLPRLRTWVDPLTWTKRIEFSKE